MAEKHIIIVLHADGTMEMEGKNFSGPECEKAMADLIALFNPKKKTEQKKPEYYQQRQVQARR